jgi:hypothetical protein
MGYDAVRRYGVLVFLLVSGSLLGASPGGAMRQPTGHLGVAYRERWGAEAKLSETINLLDLWCHYEVKKEVQCDLTIVRLNDCWGTTDRKGFFPGAVTNNSVTISSWGWNFIALDIPTGTENITYRFDFTTSVGSSGEPYFRNLTGFSGTGHDFVDGKPISWELVPLSGANNFIAAACPMMLPGVPTPEERRFLR